MEVKIFILVTFLGGPETDGGCFLHSRVHGERRERGLIEVPKSRSVRIRQNVQPV
jgi:hypothetical protein